MMGGGITFTIYGNEKLIARHIEKESGELIVGRREYYFSNDKHFNGLFTDSIWLLNVK